MGCFGRKSKKFQCTVVLLDETEIVQEIEISTRGEFLLEKVYSHLNLLEKAYFGLRFLNKSGESRWLDPLLKVSKQLAGLCSFTLYFGVKFYASDPCRLLEEITRYQFVLQLKQDIQQGRLPVLNELAAELFALSLQAELGDFDPRKHQQDYVSEFRFLPDQTTGIEKKVEQAHKTLVGQVPSAVEMTFLEKVRWLDMYGVDLHPVLGADQVQYFVGLTPSGVMILKGKKILNHYFWPRLSKVFFKGKAFMVRVKDKMNEEMTYVFLLGSKEACEYLWKCCVEHHAFFRLTQVKDVSGNPLQIFRLGSKFRYSGRTETQTRSEIVRRPPPPILRVPSRRFQKRSAIQDDDIREKENFKNSIQYGTSDNLIATTMPCPNPLYRSISTPAALSEIVQQSTTSTEVAPWENPNQSEGLFGNRRRSGSVDSTDSYKRHRRSRRSSDNESEVSKSSRGSRGSKSSRSRGGRKSLDSGSESDSHHRSRHRRRSRRSRGEYRLIESESQWKKVQEQRKEQEERAAYQSAVVRDLSNRKSGYVNSGVDTESEAPTRHRKKHRRRSRSGSRSPETVPRDVKKHLRYQLVDPSHMSEEQKKDIQYTKIESEKEIYKVRYSPSTGRLRRHRVTSSSRNSLESRNYEEIPAAVRVPVPVSTSSSSNNKKGNKRHSTASVS